MRVPPPRSSQRGSTLVTVVIALIPVAALVLLSLGTLTRYAKELEGKRASMRARNEALSALELAKGAIGQAGYDDPGFIGRNGFLGAALETSNPEDLRTENNYYVYLDTTTGRKTTSHDTPWSGLMDSDMRPYVLSGRFEPPGSDGPVDVWVTEIANSWHLLEARVEIQGVRRTARAFVREHDTFARYAVLCDRLDSQPVSVRTSGDIHSNKGVHFMFGGWGLTGYVTAVDGFGWTWGASTDNVELLGGYNDSASPITLPPLNEIQDRIKPPIGSLTGHASADDYVFVGSDYSQCTIEFNRDEVDVRAYHPATASWVDVYDGDLTNIRRIYSIPAIFSLGGDVQGTLTIATESSDGVLITDSLRYIDSDGDLAFTDVGSSDTPNPEYDGNSVIGIVAPQGSVVYGLSAPDIMEVHAAIFTGFQQTVEGLETYTDTTWVKSYDSSFVKSYLLTFGSTACGSGKFRGIASSSGTISGFGDAAYLFDEGLTRNPPPYFLQIERSIFRGAHIVEGFSDI